ncbi:hypothetical protein F441_16434 [Phytophthora nicotianae CJ01A1]|uniref:RxLR effector protein n=5 Tax=Phytophthora nicotianae TaxID=4792 RepID=V9EFU5_PHYNI|nr:hypothetical protein F443_16600 [Phytophthora nicotianae P1569]ETK77625.1 hypothetical protein L915_16131 [Phytophthora nicotianae]ETO66169.1 hypothetical protein F444_16585 [Phytophthora nicotianae P1976]ETP07255.1 hypothetical protein F441_16434 [Phytophthora nicotianae CJ01A1]ETP35331.1 hypothetical protein F442_16442 [Phytophthora nicotianae P10297]
MRYQLMLMLLAIFEAAAVTTVSQLSSNNDHTATKRALRSHTKVADGVEERGAMNIRSISDYLKSWMKGTVPKLEMTEDEITVLASQALSTKTTSSDDVFKMLKLDEGLSGILSNPNLKQFSYYLQLQKNGERSMRSHIR